MTPKKSIKKENENTFDIQKLMKDSDSYKSLIYGIVTVVVLFIVIALGVRTLQQNKAMIDDEALSTKNESQNLASDQYIVMEGETLWSIAEKTYNDGFRWEEIAKANNITDASALEKGTKLMIPGSVNNQAMESVEPTVGPTDEVSPAYAISPTLIPQNEMTQEKPEVMMTAGQKIAGLSYTIAEDDTLWDIAVRAYGDGYRWGEIATANSIDNPNLIYTGNSLSIPRP